MKFLGENVKYFWENVYFETQNALSPLRGLGNICGIILFSERDGPVIPRSERRSMQRLYEDCQRHTID